MTKEILRWQVGDVRITRVQELEAPDIRFVIPEATVENLAAIEWLGPFRAPSGHALASVHTLILEAGERRIVVDTCIGNDKPRPIPPWNMLQLPFLEDLEKAGFAPTAIDTVICTHLHIDHVGWNTRLVDGRWRPTFPNARYLLARPEWEHWSADPHPMNQTVLADSVRPIFDAGLVDLVETDHAVNAAISLEPTPGHTPGHVSVHVRSRGEEAVITGDLVHHPAQFARPHWGAAPDWDRALADRTRRAFMERYADTPVLVIGTHFAGPTAGRLVRDGDAYRLDA
jgi:glyoxylase-like metal-dependent hydrolase (beta-lactamase superfamily II)